MQRTVTGASAADRDRLRSVSVQRTATGASATDRNRCGCSGPRPVEIGESTPDRDRCQVAMRDAAEDCMGKMALLDCVINAYFVTKIFK